MNQQNNSLIRQTQHNASTAYYLFVVFVMMLHPTHELEPPANPARFSLSQF